MRIRNKPFGIKRDIDYFRENIIIAWKTLLEYKFNFIFSFMEHYIYVFAHFILFFVLIENFGSELGWSMQDFVIFFILTELAYIFAGLFVWKDWLYIYLKNGDFNTFLFRPQNPYVAFFFSNLNEYAILLIMMDVFVYSAIIFIFQIEVVNLLASSIIFFLITILYITNIEMIRSFDFIAKNIVPSTIWPAFININKMFSKFPYTFFQNSYLKYIILFIPNVLIASLLMPLLRGKDIFVPSIQISLILILIFVYIIIIKRVWNIGLRKYEAYG
jgi:ABC-type uncharacterized transport system permease subunit